MENKTTQNLEQSIPEQRETSSFNMEKFEESVGSFKLVEKPKKPMKCADILAKKTVRSQKKSNCDRKVFIGGIGTELTSKDIIKAFRNAGADITNKPVRILRGKKFNFACGVELKTEEQWEKMIALKNIETDGCTLEVRAHRQAQRKYNNKTNQEKPMSEPMVSQRISSSDTASLEKINHLKLKLYELKLMEAENLLMKAKIENEIILCERALEKEKSRSYVQSYNRIPTPKHSYETGSSSGDGNLSQAQREYLRNFQRQKSMPAVHVKKTMKNSAQFPFREENVSSLDLISGRRRGRGARESMRRTPRMSDLERRLEGVHERFYGNYGAGTPHTSLNDQGTMYTSSSTSWSARKVKQIPEDDGLDPILVENMGSLANISMTDVFQKLDLDLVEAKKVKAVQESFERLDNISSNETVGDRSNSSLLLLVKDDIVETEVDEVNVEIKIEEKEKKSDQVTSQ